MTGERRRAAGRSTLATAVPPAHALVMTSSTTTSPGTVRQDALRPEVIAGLVNDGSAQRVAVASLGYAMAHDMSVCFVHVVTPVAQRQGVEDVDEATFSAAMAAMRGHGELRCSFEVLHGDPEQVLVERSRGAGLLVVGDDLSNLDASIAAYCRRHAACDVLTVDAVGTVASPPNPHHPPTTTHNPSPGDHDEHQS